MTNKKPSPNTTGLYYLWIRLWTIVRRKLDKKVTTVFKADKIDTIKKRSDYGANFINRNIS